MSDKVKELKFGQMVQCMKDGGEKIKQVERVDLFTLMEMYMMVNGLMIKLMDMVFTVILTAPNTKEIGRKISNMVMVLKPGQTVPNSREIMSKERSMEWECLLGQMEVLILDNLLRIIFKVKENIIGLMVVSLMVRG